MPNVPYYVPPQVHQRSDCRGTSARGGRGRERGAAETGAPHHVRDEREAVPELLLPDPEGRRLPPHALRTLQHTLLLELPPGHAKVLADQLPGALERLDERNEDGGAYLAITTGDNEAELPPRMIRRIAACVSPPNTILIKNKCHNSLPHNTSS